MGEGSRFARDGETARGALVTNVCGRDCTLSAVEGRGSKGQETACSLSFQVPASRVGPQLLVRRLGLGLRVVQSIATQQGRGRRRG